MQHRDSDEKDQKTRKNICREYLVGEDMVLGRE